MSDIRIDFDRLDRAEARLNRVIQDFEATRGVQAHLPEAAAHPELRGAVGDFRSAWDVRRGQLAEELRFVRDSVVAVRETFRALDADLAERAVAYTTDAEGG